MKSKTGLMFLFMLLLLIALINAQEEECPDSPTVEYAGEDLIDNRYTILTEITVEHIDECFPEGFTVENFDFNLIQGTSDYLIFSSIPQTPYDFSADGTEFFEIHIDIDPKAPSHDFIIDIGVKGSSSDEIIPIHTLEFEWVANYTNTTEDEPAEIHYNTTENKSVENKSLENKSHITSENETVFLSPGKIDDKQPDTDIGEEEAGSTSIIQKIISGNMLIYAFILVALAGGAYLAIKKLGRRTSSEKMTEEHTKIAEWIGQMKSHGYNDAQIQNSLIAHGYSLEQWEKYFKQ